jgi:thiamine-monophosphate kinase
VEDETLERIRRALGGGIEAPGLRDDAAILTVPGGGPLIVSVDSVVAGVHVDLALCSPADVGWKALMGALSDLAAMGARPLGALVALCVPEGRGDGSLSVGVMEGVAEASASSGCPVVGGDVSTAGQLMVAVTVMGTVDDGQPVSRSGGQPGDVVLVTGPCGGSAAGLRTLRAEVAAGAEAAITQTLGGLAYRRPVARLAEGEVARRAGAHALIDVSDGLALDLHRLADASGVGFVLDPVVPVTEGATIAEALGGGEDYELVMAVAATDVEELVSAFEGGGLRTPIRLGVLTAEMRDRRLGNGELGQLGWQHRIG